MSGITVVGKDVAGGGQLGGGQDWFVVEDAAVVLDGDPVMGHGLPPHTAPVMIATSTLMTIDGKKPVRAGDSATCGHSTTGRSWFSID